MRGTWGTQIGQEDEPIRSVNGIAVKAKIDSEGFMRG
jgi:hypothetical protein